MDEANALGDNQWSAGSPEAAVVAYLGAVASENWPVALEWVLSARAIAYAEERRATVLAQEGVRRERSAADYLADNPRLPSAVAEWYAEQGRRVQGTPDPLADADFAGVGGVAELALLGDAALVQSLLEGSDLRSRMRRAYAAQGWPIPPELQETLHRGREFRIVGHVQESPALAWVLVREQGMSDTGERIEANAAAVELRREHGRWVLAPDSDLTMAPTGGVLLLGGPSEDGALTDA